MRPSLPLRCFDLCLIPEHDDAPPADNVMVTRGALNAVVFAANKQMQQGLMMIGGLSSHYCWDETSIVEQVKKIAQNTTIHWTLTTSPRTPVSTLEALLQCHMNNLQVVPFQQAKSDWLLEKISQVAQVWVTPDSVSMVYEACTSGAAVGLLALTEKAKNRVTHGLQDLVAEGRVTPYAEWLNGNALAATAQQFNEAARCAARINQLWLS
jgi:mitochondrial fission protein ELM1